MANNRTLLTVMIVLVLLVNIPAAFAQRNDPSGDRDGDGLPDNVDNCPDQAGPRENGGCPESSNSDADNSPPAEAGDADNDGLTDDVDGCPIDAGPVENGGCPLPVEAVEIQPEVELAPLPVLPTTGPCVMATAGHVAVNLRSLPWTSAPVVGTMDPQQFYPVYYFFDNPQDERWNQTSPGLAASWVTRLGGVCRGLPVLSFAEGAFGAADVGLASQFALSIDDLAFNPQPEPPPDPAALFPAEHFPFPAPQTREHVLLARFAPNVPPEPILVGLLLPAVQAAREAANATGEKQSVMFVVPGDIVGFNPQPEPPPGGDDPMPNPVEDTTQPYFQILMDILPSVAEGEGEDEIRLLPVDVVGMNLGETSIQSCEVSMKPADGDACIYTNDMGQVAACFASGMDTYCIYGYTPGPSEM